MRLPGARLEHAKKETRECGRGVSDAWATLTVDTANGRWVRDVTAYILNAGLYTSPVTALYAFVQKSVDVYCLGPDIASFCCCDVPGGHTLVPYVCTSEGWSCPSGAESGACDDLTFCASP